MRWWLQTNPPYLMSVDNASVSGMDFSALLATMPDLWMVQWTEGKGEIERIEFDEHNEASNLNGLREQFIDIMPYAPLFQQFLTKLQAKALLLPQAKKVQVDLIREIFESKRQAPFYYPVAAGNYYWDATDESLFSSVIPAIQNATAKLNEVLAALNAAVAHVNANIVAIINQNAGLGNGLIGLINSQLVAEVNAFVVTPHNNSLAHENAEGNGLIAYINGTILSTWTGSPGVNNVNNGLRTIDVGGTPGQQGLTADIAHTTQSWANPYAATGLNALAPGTFNNASAIPWTPLTNVATSNAQWIPIGGTAPVNVTPAEQAGIMNGIAARTNALNIKKNTKIGQVNALTTIPAVIAYNVTTGW